LETANKIIESVEIFQISVQSSTVKLLLSELFCTAQDLCMGVFLCNPTIQQSSAMQEKKRSSKISKDHQRSAATNSNHCCQQGGIGPSLLVLSDPKWFTDSIEH